MIAFGVAITKPEPYERYAERGIRRAAERRLAGARLRRRRPGGAHLQPASSTTPAVATTSRRWCSCIRTWRSPTPTSATRSARRCAIRRSASSGAWAPPGVRSIAWWEGGVSWAASSTATGSTAAGTCPRTRGRSRDRRRARWTRSTARCSCCRPGRCETCASTSRCSWTMASTSTTAGGSRAAGRQVVTADVRAIYHHALALVDDLDLWVQAHMQLAEQWEASRRRGRLGAAGATSRGRTRGGASDRIHAHARGRDAHPGAGAGHGRGDRHAVMAVDGAAAPDQQLARRGRPAAARSPGRGGSRPWRPPAEPVAMPARMRSADSRSATREGARLEQPP